MAYDEGMAQRVREILGGEHDVNEKKMFGGLSFLVGGHMACGLTTSDFMVRVGPEAYAGLLSEPHAKEMTFTGKPLKGMLYVEGAGLEEDADLRRWVSRGLSFCRSMPPKPLKAEKLAAKKKASTKNAAGKNAAAKNAAAKNAAAKNPAAKKAPTKQGPAKKVATTKAARGR